MCSRRLADKLTKSELLKDARSLVPEVQPLDLSRQSPGPVIVDVREKDETDAGMLPGAKPVPRGFLELRIEETVPDRGADVVLYCAGGTRSLLAARTLKDMGYTRVRSLAGGFSAWKSAALINRQTWVNEATKEERKKRLRTKHRQNHRKIHHQERKPNPHNCR